MSRPSKTPPSQESGEKTTSDGCKTYAKGGSGRLGGSGGARASSSAHTTSHAATRRGSWGARGHGRCRIGSAWLHRGIVRRASGVRGLWASAVDADALELSTLGHDDRGGRSTADIKERCQCGSDNHEIICGNTERSSGSSDLPNEVPDLSVGQVHEPVAVSRNEVVRMERLTCEPHTGKLDPRRQDMQRPLAWSIQGELRSTGKDESRGGYDLSDVVRMGRMCIAYY